MIVECIKDDEYKEEHLKWIKEFPIKGELYTVRKREHTVNGLGYLLDEIVNPLMSNGVEPNFSSKRFRTVSTDSIEEESIKQQLKYAF